MSHIRVCTIYGMDMHHILILLESKCAMYIMHDALQTHVIEWLLHKIARDNRHRLHQYSQGMGDHSSDITIRRGYSPYLDQGQPHLPCIFQYKPPPQPRACMVRLRTTPNKRRSICWHVWGAYVFICVHVSRRYSTDIRHILGMHAFIYSMVIYT